MSKLNTLCLSAVVLSSLAFAEAPKAGAVATAKEEKPAAAAAAPAGAMDMSKAGPWTRKPANEAKTKKEVEDFFKAEDELAAKHEMDAMLGRIDFPVFMVTDDAKGAVSARPTSKDEYIAEMKPFFENMPKDMKTTHKPTISVLSDSLVQVTDDFVMTSGKNKLAGRNTSLLVKVDGNWKWKSMVEAGWGGMGPPANATAPAAAPAKTTAAAPAAPAPAAAPKK